MSKIEQRFHRTELRADSMGDEPALVGYAAVHNSESQDLGGFKEVCAPGCFDRSLRDGNDVKFLVNHNPDTIMGRVGNKTLQLWTDSRGLKFRVVLPKTQAARDLYESVKRQDMCQCSFAFTVRDQEWSDVRDGNGDMYALRTLRDVDLLDVSSVTYPAYSATDVSARQFFPDGEPVEVRSARERHQERPGIVPQQDAERIARAMILAAELGFLQYTGPSGRPESDDDRRSRCAMALAESAMEPELAYLLNRTK